jgi:predicted CXXCH cytochrome family protein
MANKQDFTLLVLTAHKSPDVHIQFRQHLILRSFIEKIHQWKRCIKALAGVVILSVVSVSTVNAVTVAGTKHDLSIYPAIIGGLGSCSYCHGPHPTGDSQLPMWARTETQTVFTLYSSPTMDATVEQPGPMSLVCLSCHDGVTAFDALYGSTGTADNDMNTIFPGSHAIMGSNLSDDHPVGVVITADSTGIRDESTITGAGLEVYDSKVECASCHDAHGTPGYPAFLRIDPNSSALCLACHIK